MNAVQPGGEISGPYAQLPVSPAGWSPFALDPHHESRAAVGPGMMLYQVAWAFIPLVIGDLDELISRWADWLAQAATGRLCERDPQGSWRR